MLKYCYTRLRVSQYIFVIIFILSGFLYSSEIKKVTYEEPNVALGFKGGYNYANFIGDDIKEYNSDYYKGLSLGVFLDIPINKFFSIQIELNYHEKGSDKLVEFIEFYDPGSNWSDDLYFKEEVIYGFKLHYIELPVILKFHSIELYNFEPVFYCGLSASINHKSEMWVKDGGISENVSVNESEDSIDEDIKHYDFNALFGVELGYHINKFNIYFDFRYNLGLVEIYKEELVDFKNSVFTTTIGFGYTLNPIKRSSIRLPKRGYD